MTDIAADTTTTAAVAVGGSATGEIETAADKDWFEVELEAGRTYRFDLQGAPGGHGTLSDTFLRRILDAEGNKSTGDGQHRTYNDDFQGSRDSRVTFTATEAGTYYVEASGDRDETGTYRLTVTDVTPVPVVVKDAAPVPAVVKDAAPVPVVVTDIAADTTTTADVAVGGSATGEIETAGDKDWFEVELEAGRTYRFDLQGAPGGHGTLSDTFLRRILDAEGNKSTGDGQHRTYNDDFQGSRDSRVTFTATEAGKYYVEASGDRDETGTYRLTVTDVTPVPVVVKDAAPVPVVVPDVTPEPEVEEPERQIIRPPFGVAGPPSVVSLLEMGFPDAQVITDSDEEPLVSQQQRAGDDYSQNIITTGRVAVGGSATGEIHAPPTGFTAGDVDWFKVQLEAGKTYRIDLEGAPGGHGTLRDPRIRGVYDADGDKAPGTFATFDSARARGQDDELLFTPESGGTYYIAAASLIQVRIGTYRLSVTEIDTSEADRAEFKSRSSSATTVEVGDVDNPPTGDISTDRERDFFAVELEARARYRIDMEGVDAALARPRIFGVYDERGDQVDHITGFRGNKFAVLDIEAPTAGTYYIVLGRVADSSSGRYRLSVTRTDDYSADTRTAGTVEVGGFATGEIETRGDVDWFKVELEMGVQYEIGVLGSAVIAGALRDPYLVGIHDSSGNLIENTTDDNSGADRNSGVNFDASTGGIYYIAVRSADGGTGTYHVNVSRRMGDDDYADGTGTTGTVAVGGFATGRIEVADDADWFAVELLAGVEYRIDLRGSDTFAGTLGNPVLLGVWDGATKLEGSDDDDDGGEGFDSRLSKFGVEADGTYYIAVGNSDPFGVGTYRLSVTATSVFGVVKHAATDIAVGGSAKGGHRAIGREGLVQDPAPGGGGIPDRHQGCELRGKRTRPTGRCGDPYLWGIYKPNGARIPGTEKNDGGVGYNTRFVFELANDGTYYIATAGNAHYTGTYTVEVDEVM